MSGTKGRFAVFFIAGVGLFLLVKAGWGEQGVRAARIAAIVVMGLVLLAIGVLMIAKRRRRVRGVAASDIAALIRIGKADDAVRLGRELYAKAPADPYVTWYFTAALIQSRHIAEARRVFSTLQKDSLPPKMAAQYDDVKKALDQGA
jgi:hypothetical protein